MRHVQNEIDGKSAIEDHYYDINRVWKRFIEKLASSNDLLHVIDYINSTRLGTFGDTYRSELTPHLWTRFPDECKMQIEETKDKVEIESSVFLKISKRMGFID